MADAPDDCSNGGDEDADENDSDNGGDGDDEVLEADNGIVVGVN